MAIPILAARLRYTVIAALGLLACQTVAGIEERKLDPTAADAASPACKSYCANVMAACVGKNAVYETDGKCLAVCAQLEPDLDGEAAGNTLACRAIFAKAALTTEPEENCRAAGPGGDGVCGTDCEAYCDLFAKLCPDDNLYTLERCNEACPGVTDQRRFDVSADHDGDTIECRLVHVSSAAERGKAADHCPHAALIPSDPWCTGKAEEPPTCEQYCSIQLEACEGALTQYESPQQCLDVCGALDLGRNDDETGNTVACRRYHSFSSILTPEAHCYHSGPTGDGHCGDASPVTDGHTGNCESYCTLAAAACPAQFEAELGDAEQCMAACVMLDEAERDAEYSVAAAKKSTGLSCRILQTARAFADPSSCDAAMGAAPCR